MSLIVDGVRSLRRKWFADRLLEKVKMLGLPAKTLIWEGFLFRVKYLDEAVNTRHIKAPMGLVAIASGPDGLRLFTADWWRGAFSKGRDLYGYAGNDQRDAAHMGEALESARLTPARLTVGPWGDPALGNVFELRDQLPAQPSLLPAGISEDVVCAVCLQRRATGGGIPELAELRLSLFDDSGRGGYQTKSVWNMVGGAISGATMFLMQHDRWVQGYRTNFSQFQALTTGDALMGDIIPARSRRDLRIRMLRSAILAALFPQGLRDLFINYRAAIGNNGVPPYWGSGGYAFRGPQGGFAVMQALILSDRRYNYNNQYLEEGGAAGAWRLAYCILGLPELERDMTPEAELAALNGMAGIAVNAAQFLPLLDQLSSGRILRVKKDGATVPPEYTVGGVAYNEGNPPYDIGDPNLEIDWDDAEEVFQEIVCAWPNHVDAEPHDGVLFHSENAIHSWTRTYGGVRIGAGGMQPVAMTMPDAVTSTEGVRPVISYAGDGLYFCVCDNIPEGRVEAVCIGSPFTGWRELDLTDPVWRQSGGEILHVRPMLATAERTALLSVVREPDGEGGRQYRAAHADGNPNEPGAMRLELLGTIPVGDVDDEGNPWNAEDLRWDICAFGEGEYTEMLMDFPSPPPASPQRAYSKDYAMYERGRWRQ